MGVEEVPRSRKTFCLVTRHFQVSGIPYVAHCFAPKLNPGSEKFYSPPPNFVAPFICFVIAHGDMKEGQGTIGGRAPEAMMRRKVACEPSQDVYALAHLVLLTFSKNGFKSHNMWVSEVGAGLLLSFLADVFRYFFALRLTQPPAIQLLLCSRSAFVCLPYLNLGTNSPRPRIRQ